MSFYGLHLRVNLPYSFSFMFSLLHSLPLMFSSIARYILSK